MTNLKKGKTDKAMVEQERQRHSQTKSYPIVHTSVEANAQQLPQSLWSRTRPMTDAHSEKASRPSKLAGMSCSTVAVRRRRPERATGTGEVGPPPVVAAAKLGVFFVYVLRMRGPELERGDEMGRRDEDGKS